MMSYGKIIAIWAIVISWFACWFLFGNVHHFFPGITKIGEFSTGAVEHEVFDVKAGNRACLVISSQVKDQPQPRFFFSCPQER